jgi:hypothetical protein
MRSYLSGAPCRFAVRQKIITRSEEPEAGSQTWRANIDTAGPAAVAATRGFDVVEPLVMNF